MQRTLARCAERCGWVGQVVTGWVDVPADKLHEAMNAAHADAEHGAPPSYRWRGQTMQHRRRLRDGKCPGCGARGLDRAQGRRAADTRRGTGLTLVRRSL